MISLLALPFSLGHGSSLSWSIASVLSLIKRSVHHSFGLVRRLIILQGALAFNTSGSENFAGYPISRNPPPFAFLEAVCSHLAAA